MNKLFRHLLFSLLTVPVVQAQVIDPEFTNVAKRFEKGNFESALETAEALIDNDKHRKKPEPYLWASMCYYEIGRTEDEKLLSRFRNPLKSALKYAAKAVSKDKEGTFIEKNREFLVTLKKAGIEEAMQQEADGDFRKASYTYKQLMKMFPDDPYIRFAKGIVDIRLNSYSEAERNLKKAMPELSGRYRDLDYQPDPVSSPLLRPAMLFYIDHLIENGYTDSARNVTMNARVFFPLDEEIKTRMETVQ